VKGHTLHSDKLPAADLAFGEQYRYLGTQVVNLYGNAEAEQHAFAAIAPDGSIRSLYWVQFEHFLPTNKMTYDYDLKGRTEIGGVPFVYDVKSFAEYATMQNEDPASDGAALGRLLATQHLAFPQRVARARMFHLPTPDHRTELMIIYVEEVPLDSNIPLKKEGVILGDVSPESANAIVTHALQGLTIRNYNKPKS